jgi:general secretion pathway protein D
VTIENRPTCHRASLLALPVLALWLLAAPVATYAQAQAQTQTQGAITPNYKDADLSQIIEAVSAVTGKNFIVDPRVRAQVTMLSSTPMTPQAFYEAFLSILQVHGFVAVPSGDVVKIIPDANARQVPGNDLPSRLSSTSDEIVTQVIAIRNVSAAQLVPILRPLIPQYGHLAAYPASNMLIISDRSANVSRMIKIISRIDQAGDEEIDVIPMEHASASDVVRIVTTLSAGAAAEGGGAGPNVKLVADDRTNSVLVSGERSQRLRLKTLIAHLDTPLEAGGDTQVRYLRYADAEKIAAKLREQLQGIVAAAAPGAGGGAAPAPTGGGGQIDRSITIWAEPETNALVVTAPPKVMRSVMSIVDRLDIRRAQVLVEAILVELSADKAMDLGVNWAVASDGSSNLPAGGWLAPVKGVGLGEIIAALTGNNSGDGGSTTITPPTGLTIGIGERNENGTSWAALVRALNGIGNTNIIATPSVVTLDNEEAEIKIAQEVPFLTGQYVTQGNTSQNPFQTIQREEVGNILKITPQINEGDSVLLKISQEASNVAASAQQVSTTDLITNKRTISTKVMVEDGGIIVLGGLISDEATESKQQVPFLGSIPFLGELFKVRSVTKTKRNLMVFIRPRILRDGVDAAIETNAKYNYIRDQQRNQNKGKVPLMPGESQPTLPPLESLVPPALLNPARTAAPPGTTPAERATATGTGTTTPAPTNTTSFPGAAPPPATTTTPPPATTAPPPATQPPPTPDRVPSDTAIPQGTTP